MQLIFLGTGAGRPSLSRNVSAIALDLRSENGEIWLFDCGEATQHQMMRKIHHQNGQNITISPSKIDKIFITHLHGDHVFGLFGLLTSRSMDSCKTPVTIVGPIGIKNLVDCVISSTESSLCFDLDIIEISSNEFCENPITIIESDKFIVRTIPLSHRIQSLAYRIEEREKRGKLDINALKKIGVNNPQILQTLKKGHDFILNNQTTLFARDFLFPPIKERSIVIFGDTSPCDNAFKIALNADLIVHEATLDNSMQEIANSRGHSTTKQVAMLAKRAKVKALIVTHLSSRYNKTNTIPFLSECTEIFPNTTLAEDLTAFDIT